MKRTKLYSDILTRILTMYSHLHPGTIDYMDVEDNMRNEDIDAAAMLLASAPNIPEALKPLLLTIKDVYNVNNKNDEIAQEYKVVKLFNKLSKDIYKRDLFYRGTGLTVIESAKVYPDDVNQPYSESVWLSLQSLMYIDTDMNALIDALAGGKRDGYLLGFSKRDLGYSNGTKLSRINNENLYAFALASVTHDKVELPIDNNLLYDVTAVVFNSFAFNKKINYLQYYDIYDVLQEWLRSKDILTAFLRMYQIVEFIIYRKQMYNVVNSASLKQSFLRGVKNVDRKFNDNERTSIMDGIKKLFPGIIPPTPKIRKAEKFIGEYFGKTDSGKPYLNSTTPSREMDSRIARFIYDMRCSIVHSKEAEFHMTLQNYDTYKDLVPLATYVHDEMMKKVWDLLNTPSNGIEYEHKQLDLY